MAEIDRKRMDKVMGYVEELAERDRKLIREHVSGIPVGQEQVTDAEFRAWFELKAAEQPVWVLELPMVSGGMALIRRYERIAGITEGAS